MKIYSQRDVTVDMIQIAGVGDKPRVMYEVIPGVMVTLSFIQLTYMSKYMYRGTGCG
jgi:hypothetical protein